MALPRMSPRRWFWTLMSVALAWQVAGYRWYEDLRQQNWMRDFQGGVTQPLRLVLVPAEFTFGGLQSLAAGVVRGAVESPPGGLALADRVKELEEENVWLKGKLREARSRLILQQGLPLAGIAPENVVPATVLSWSAGPGSSLLHLDKGLLDGVTQGAAVLAARIDPAGHAVRGLTLLGRVESAGQKESVVRLVTDSSMRLSAHIVRPVVQPDGSGAFLDDLPITAEPCLVEGMGLQMKTDSLGVRQGIAPRKGDLVVLWDSLWAAQAQHTVIGQVEEFRPRVDQPLRYEVTIVPRIPISGQRTVMVLKRSS